MRELKLDDNGMIINVPVHDGVISGFNFSEQKKAITLSVKNNKSENISFSLKNVRDFNFNGICRGAIVSEVFMWNIETTQNFWGMFDSP